jgi:CO/xanthine dehydrogenase FAD-binding subunit
MTAAAWLRPTSLQEACAALADGYTPIGGGAALASMSFPPTLRGKALDLSGLGLQGRDGTICGAQLTLEAALQDHAVRDGWPAIWQAIAGTGTPEIRRLATFGGTVGAALPTSDLLAALCAHQARVECADAGGTRRWLPLLTYLTDQPSALVLRIDLGPPRDGCFRRFAGRPGFAPAVASVATVLVDGQPQVWAGAVAATPRLLDLVALPDESTLRDDEQYSAWFRRRLLGTLREETLALLSAPSRAPSTVNR